MKRMGSVLFFVSFLCMLFLYFRLTVGREVDGPLWAVMTALEAHMGGLGVLPGLQAAVLSRSRGLWTILGRSAGLSGRSWATLGAYVNSLGLSWGPCGRRSWAALGHSAAVLGCS